MIRTVGDLIVALQNLDPALPVARLTYDPEKTVASPVCVAVQTVRAQCPGEADAFSGSDENGARVNVPHWFALGSKAALYHESRGGTLQQVVVLGPGD